MPVAKKENASVRVETKKMSGDHCMMGTCCHKCCYLVGKLIMLAILVVLIIFYCQYNRNEAMKVGGRDNYKLVKQIYRNQAFHDQQAQQIQSALQTFAGGTTAQQVPVVPTVTE